MVRGVAQEKFRFHESELSIDSSSESEFTWGFSIRRKARVMKREHPKASSDFKKFGKAATIPLWQGSFGFCIVDIPRSSAKSPDCLVGRSERLRYSLMRSDEPSKHN